MELTLSILGTEVYFLVDTHRENLQYLMRQFTELPNINILALQEILDVFGDSIQVLPELKAQIDAFE